MGADKSEMSPTVVQLEFEKGVHRSQSLCELLCRKRCMPNFEERVQEKQVEMVLSPL